MCMFGNLKQEVTCEKQVNVFLRKTLHVSGGLSYLEIYTTERLRKILLVVSLRNILLRRLPTILLVVSLQNNLPQNYLSYDLFTSFSLFIILKSFSDNDPLMKKNWGFRWFLCQILLSLWYQRWHYADRLIFPHLVGLTLFWCMSCNIDYVCSYEKLYWSVIDIKVDYSWLIVLE